MKTAVYPGSFNPFHQGHLDVVQKAASIFDQVIILKANNLDKIPCKKELIENLPKNVKVELWDSLLVDYIRLKSIDVVIKGIRNIQDFEYEKTQQYWNEDLGITVPTFYVITDRKFSHISSSAIRTVDKLKST